MNSYSRNLLVLFNNASKNEQDIKEEISSLREILLTITSTEHFYMAHELVDRNRITSNKKKILKESRHLQVRAFRFFINKN